MSFASGWMRPEHWRRRMTPEWFAQRLGIADLKGRAITWVNVLNPDGPGCRVRCILSVPGTTYQGVGEATSGKYWTKLEVSANITGFEAECVQAVEMALIQLDAALEGKA